MLLNPAFCYHNEPSEKYPSPAVDPPPPKMHWIMRNLVQPLPMTHGGFDTKKDTYTSVLILQFFFSQHGGRRFYTVP